ncbi:OV-16 antigen [Hypsizygus marmoreus]|uniref:OV-16 antigen n=1 Tax=Hypsizygus marmoreus TaxID=39966 RepID=A0A369JDB9_HYPMA|nr:OV-16 antigen [Hypsizygus marmoreus]
MRHVAILVLSLLPRVLAQANSPLLTNVTQAFSQAQIVPDVLPSFAPTALANITFSASTANQSLNVTPGAVFTEAQTANEPGFSLISSSTGLVANETFVLALVDPDAPTPQNRSVSQVLHFLGGDFHVNATSSNPTLLVNRSAALMDFIPPMPPAGSPPHRYVLVVYTQPADFNETALSFVNASTPRTNFNLSTFATSVNLDSPVAGNFFLVGPDDSTSTTSAAPPATAPPSTSTTAPAPSATAPPSTAQTTASDSLGGAPSPTEGVGTTSGASADKMAMIGPPGYVGLLSLILLLLAML